MRVCQNIHTLLHDCFFCHIFIEENKNWFYLSEYFYVAVLYGIIWSILNCCLRFGSYLRENTVLVTKPLLLPQHLTSHRLHNAAHCHRTVTHPLAHKSVTPSVLHRRSPPRAWEFYGPESLHLPKRHVTTVNEDVRASIIFMSPPGSAQSYYVLDAQAFLSLTFQLTESKLSLVLYPPFLTLSSVSARTSEKTVCDSLTDSHQINLM